MAGTAHAEDETVVDRSSTTSTDPGVTLGVRPGFALPLGRTASGPDGVALSDTMVGTLPIWVDLGYRINANVYVGVWGQLGFGLPRGCPAGASCFARNLRFGPNVHVRLRPRAALDPWIGAGAGYDILALAARDATERSPGVVRMTMHGFELANVQAGLDWLPSPSQIKAMGRLGPYVGYAVGIYSRQTVETGGPRTDGSIASTSAHHWLTFGLRGAVDL